MKINKAIRAVMRQKGISLSAMGSSLRKVDRKTGEVKSLIGNDVSARLTNDNLSIDKAVEMLNVLGYEIVIQEKKPGNRRADQIVIDQNDSVNLDDSSSDEPLKVKINNKSIDLDTMLSDEPPTKPKTSGKRIKLI